MNVLFDLRILSKYLLICGFSANLFADIGFHRLESLPKDLSHFVGEANWSADSLEKMDFSALNLNQVTKTEFRLEMPSATSVFESGQPSLPVLTKTISVPAGYRAEIKISNVVVEESDAPVPLKKVPQAHVWSEGLFQTSEPKPGYFPGEILRTRDRGDTLAVNIFPAQFDTRTGKVVMVRSMEMWVQYLPGPQVAVVRDLLVAPSLIITSSVLKDSAIQLKRLHEEKFGIRTDIAIVEQIEKTTEPVDEKELPDGYKEASDKDTIAIPWNAEAKTGYNYQLARKIIQFIRNRASEGVGFKYVTILGDSTLVPPSYYFNLPSTFTKKWGVTDQCYSSSDKCLHADFALGRLPFHTNNEVKSFIVKAENYLSNSAIPSPELALLGGKAFPNSEVYIGELGALEPIDSLKTDWTGVKKYFRTKKNYNKQMFMGLARGEMDSKFVYSLDHGTGNQWYIEKEFVSSNEVSEAKAVPHAKTPIVVSISCVNAAFDEAVSKESLFGAEKNGSQSVGVSLLKAEAGAVAYWGSARIALGSPIYDFDAFGNLKFKGTDYGLQLLSKFFEKYGELRKGRLGDFVLLAQRAYVVDSGNDMKSESNAWTYYIATLLGDPALPLPERPESQVNYPTGSSQTAFPSTGVGIPQMEVTLPKDFSLNVGAVNAVHATLLHWVQNPFGSFAGEEVVADVARMQGAGKLDLKITTNEADGVYFLRLENVDGVPRERQVWFNVVEKTP